MVLIPGKPATDTEPGLTDGYYCSECGQTIVEQQIIPIQYKTLNITAQPSSVTGSVGKKAVFTVEAEGTGLTYKWQYYNGHSWSSSTATGYNTNKLSVKITEARDGQKYRCKITDSKGVIKYSKSVKLTALYIPIMSQPVDCVDKVGKTAKFHVEAEGTGLTYKWQYYNGHSWSASNATGSNTNTLSIKITEARDAQEYRCIITDTRGAKVISNTVSINIGQKLTITSQPYDLGGNVLDTATSTVIAKGEDLRYRWKCYYDSEWHDSTVGGYDTNTITHTIGIGYAQ